MKLFKTKEEKLILLNNKLKELEKRYKEFNNNIMLIGNYVFVFRGFEIKNNEIQFCYQDRDTPSNGYNLFPFSIWSMKYGNDFREYRKNWIYLKDTLDRLGVDVIIREEK